MEQDRERECQQAPAPCQRGVTGGEEGAPPPVVVLGAELEVDEHHRDLGARRYKDEEHEQREAEHVVVLVHPHGGEDEEELDKAGAEGKDAANQHLVQQSMKHER